MDRFWAKVNKTDGCWEWSAAVGSHGYGAFGLDGSMKLAHRVAYELCVGPIPLGSELDHLCRNTRCVNPEHLEPVDHTENVRRGTAGRHNAAKKSCPKGHVYDNENTAVKSDKRFCLECRREYNSRWRERETRLSA